MGSDLHYFELHALVVVSIHAPTWGATQLDMFYQQRNEVSIHAPTWGATMDAFALYLKYTFQSTLPHGERPYAGIGIEKDYGFNPRSHMGSDSSEAASIWPHSRFNPRSHMGSDLILLDRLHLHRQVSIHAPTWGAT